MRSSSTPLSPTNKSTDGPSLVGVQQYDPPMKESDVGTGLLEPPSGSTGEITEETSIDIGSGSANAENAGSRNEDWYKAIEGKDCKKLLEIFQRSPGSDRWILCYETGEESRNVLHVACMQGCFPLAKEVIDIAVDDNNSMRGKLNLYDVEEGRSGLTPRQMADDIIGNRSITEYLENKSFDDYWNSYTIGERFWNDVMYKAYPDTDWNRALVEGNCASLRMLFAVNTRYLLEYSTTDLDGRNSGLTVLDVAIMKNDIELVKKVVDAFKPHKKICWEDSYFPSELSWECMIEGTSLTNKRSSLELAKNLGRKEILQVMENPCSFDDVSDDVHIDEKADSLFGYEGANSFISAGWDEEWNEEFDADVDYNFEQDQFRRELLRFHYVCKHPKKFLHICFPIFHPGPDELDIQAVDFLSMLHDAQGRTPFQTMLEYFNHEESEWIKLSQWLTSTRTFPLQTFLQTRDSRGRSSLMRATVKQYLEEQTKVSNFLANAYDCTRPKFLKTSFPDLLRVLDLALYLEDRHIVQQSLLEGEYSYNIEKLNEIQAPPILIAAALGNQSMLRMLLKDKFDPMVVDKNGRTSLHYAADSTLLEFDPPLHYFGSIENLRKVKDKWTKRKEQIRLQVESNDKLNVGRQACILMLQQLGVDLSQVDKNGDIPDPGTTNDASFQSWWYNIQVKDTIDQKNSFNQAGNALSVVGTLVAATSYVGPLQPPLSYSATGYIDTSELLIRMFMVTNTLAFYLAIASVMFAVVPSLPMPQEGVIDELRRARHTVSFSLCLLLGSIVCVIISFASATAVVIENYEFLVFGPSIIGWFFCLVAIVSFFIRLMRLMFYTNKIVRGIYKFSFSTYCKDKWKVLSREE